MLAKILEHAGLAPGSYRAFAPTSAFGAAGGSPLILIEADEYDTAFFDKRRSSSTTSRARRCSTILEYTTRTFCRPWRRI